MLNKQAVIFDMDGVIVDSEKFWSQAEKEVFTSLGVKVTDELAEKTKSLTTSEVTEFWYSIFPWQDKDLDIVEQMVVSKVIDLIKTEECSISGVKNFIENLKAKNYKIGLATNSPTSIIQTVLQKFDLAHLFDTVSSAEFEEKGKPNPAIYFTAAKKLGINPENCIVIEDSQLGMLAAKNAGMTVVAFTNGNNKIDFEIADYKIDDFENFNTDKLKLV